MKDYPHVYNPPVFLTSFEVKPSQNSQLRVP